MNGIEKEIVSILQNAQSAISEKAPIAWEIAVRGTQMEGTIDIASSIAGLVIASLMLWWLLKRLKTENLHGEFPNDNIFQVIISGCLGVGAFILFLAAGMVLLSSSTWLSIFSPEYVVIMKMIDGVKK